MTSFQPAAFAASSERATRASPMPWLRNTGSTINGPSSRAEAPPMAIGVMAEAPTRGVPTRATKLKPGSAAGGGPGGGDEPQAGGGGRRPGGGRGGGGNRAGANPALFKALDRPGVVA